MIDQCGPAFRVLHRLAPYNWSTNTRQNHAGRHIIDTVRILVPRSLDGQKSVELALFRRIIDRNTRIKVIGSVFTGSKLRPCLETDIDVYGIPATVPVEQLVAADFCRRQTVFIRLNIHCRSSAGSRRLIKSVLCPVIIIPGHFLNGLIDRSTIVFQHSGSIEIDLANGMMQSQSCTRQRLKVQIHIAVAGRSSVRRTIVPRILVPIIPREPVVTIVSGRTPCSCIPAAVTCRTVALEVLAEADFQESSPVIRCDDIPLYPGLTQAITEKCRTRRDKYKLRVSKLNIHSFTNIQPWKHTVSRSIGKQARSIGRRVRIISTPEMPTVGEPLSLDNVHDIIRFVNAHGQVRTACRPNIRSDIGPY